MALTTISITAPSSAKAGDIVNFVVKVHNKDTKGHSFRIDVYFPTFGARILNDEYQWIWQNGLSGDEEVYELSGTMPTVDAEVLVYVYYYDNGWEYDNYLKKNITMSGVAQEESEFRNLSVVLS